MKVLGTWVLAGFCYVRILVAGVTYQHPHRFTDKIEAAMFAGKVALVGDVDLTRWEKVT